MPSVSLTFALALATAPGPERQHHRRAEPAPAAPMESRRIVVEGRLEQGEDGAWILARPLSRSARLAAALAQQVPLAAIADAARQPVRIAPGGPTPLELAASRGDWVRAELRRDRSGERFLVRLLEPRRRPPVQPR